MSRVCRCSYQMDVNEESVKYGIPAIVIGVCRSADEKVCEEDKTHIGKFIIFSVSANLVYYIQIFIIINKIGGCC